jgi:hypothetical protein
MTAPLFRLYDTIQGDHLYTTSSAERDQAVATLGYTDEGIAAYVSATPQNGLVPLYRLWNASAGHHPSPPALLRATGPIEPGLRPRRHRGVRRGALRTSERADRDAHAVGCMPHARRRFCCCNLIAAAI